MRTPSDLGVTWKEAEQVIAEGGGVPIGGVAFSLAFVHDDDGSRLVVDDWERETYEEYER